MISKQSKVDKKRPASAAKIQPEVDTEFDESVDHEANLHSPQVADYQTMEPFSGAGPELEVPAKEMEKTPDVAEITADDVSYMLGRHPEIDTSNIIIKVDKGEVILSGSVPEERMKFMAAEIVKLIHGVKMVSNHLKHSRVQ